MKITENFKREEFDCTDGTDYPKAWITRKLLPLCQALEKIREALGGKSIVITSGYRTENYNQKIGGSKNSYHVQGLAVDFKVAGVKASVVYDQIEKLIEDKIIPEGGLGKYPTWVHYDQRGFKARW